MLYAWHNHWLKTKIKNLSKIRIARLVILWGIMKPYWSEKQELMKNFQSFQHYSMTPINLNLLKMDVSKEIFYSTS